MTTNPFSFKTSFVRDIEIGDMDRMMRYMRNLMNGSES